MPAVTKTMSAPAQHLSKLAFGLQGGRAALGRVAADAQALGHGLAELDADFAPCCGAGPARRNWRR